ncbi:MAG: hypothetical protein FWG25_03730 [Promicromonosporaceae bacterium]|nr:hypothetical protein [Promicromonosporaceae bacterium]
MTGQFLAHPCRECGALTPIHREYCGSPCPTPTRPDIAELDNYRLTVALMDAAQDHDINAMIEIQDELLRRLGTPYGETEVAA